MGDAKEAPPAITGGMSNEVILTAVLEGIGSGVRKTGRGYLTAACPFASMRHESGVDRNPSFGVVYDAHEAKFPAGHAHCFSCGYSGDIRDVVSLYYAWGIISRDEFASFMGLLSGLADNSGPLSLSLSDGDDPFPDEAWLHSFPQVSRSTRAAVDYLDARGISGKAVRHFDLRFDPQRYRVVAPLRDRAQRFRGLIGRTLLSNPTGPRYFYYPYKNHPPKGFTWFNESSLDLSKPVVVVEGIFDAMKVWPVYPNVTAALSVGFRSPGMGWHHQVDRWISFFDTGKGGDLGRERLSRMMVGPGVRIWHLMPPPGRKDPGESTPEEILSALNSLKRRG